MLSNRQFNSNQYKTKYKPKTQQLHHNAITIKFYIPRLKVVNKP